jgi:CelD/BcsL family acetyltransferase involved in cellulose biosynthesis
LTTGFQVEMLRGRDALGRAMTPERVRQWQALADATSTVVLYQSPGFVLPWYEVYEAEYEPLFLLATAADGTLAGILPLALRRPLPGGLSFAGAEHCEYASWLATAAAQLEFPAACVSRLAEHGHFDTMWDWKWLAPGTNLAWLERPELAARGITARVLPYTTPILGLRDADRPRFFDPKGKNFKRKINLLKRAGEVRIARLDTQSLTEKLFDRFKTLYDIRQLARYGIAPFGEDPLKGPFHRRLLEVPDLALCFALMVGADPVAFHWSLVDRRRAVHCMSPFDMRWLNASPGKLMVDLVAEALRERGMEWLDHTPGGDEYKEEAASTHEPIHRLLLFPSRRRAWAYGIETAARDMVKRAARVVGVSPAGLRVLQERAIRAARSPVASARVAARSLRAWAWSSTTMITYRLTRQAWERTDPDSKPDPLFHKDMLEDFLRYAGSFRWISRQHLMQSAIERLRRGSHCYTVVEDGVLIYYAWLHPGVEEMDLSEVGYRYPLPPNGAVLYDDRTDVAAVRALIRRSRGSQSRERRGGLQKRSFRHRFHEAFAMGADYVAASIVATNTLSTQNLVNLGIAFEPVDRVTQVTRFGRRRAWREPVSGDPGAPSF